MYSDLITISNILKAVHKQWSVVSSMLMVTNIPAGRSARDKRLVKHLSSEVFCQKNEKRSTCFYLAVHQDGPFTAEPRSPKTLICLSPDLKRKERPIWKQVNFSVKRPVSAKPQMPEIQVLLIPIVYVLPSSGGGGWGGIRGFGGKI